MGGDKGVGTGVDEDPLALQHFGGAVLHNHLDVMAVREAAGAGQNIHIRQDIQLLKVLLAKPGCERSLALDGLPVALAALLKGTACGLGASGLVLQIFGGNTRHVDAGASVHFVGLLNHRHRLSCLRQRARQCLSSLAKTNNDILIVPHGSYPLS